MVPILLFIWYSLFPGIIRAYTVQGRFGHSAVIVNDSIYFYGGDSSLSSAQVNESLWIADLAILPIHTAYQLTDPPWKPASGPQTSVGGPAVYSHIAFMGGINNGNMIIIGGVMPQTDNITSDDEPTAYSYDCDLGRWNSFTLPSGNHLNRQGAASTTTEHGITYIWGGKRASITPVPATPNTTNSNSTKAILTANMYRFDSVYPANSTIVASDAQIYPPLRYAHTQTLISDHRIVVLGGFNSATGDAVSMADVWVFDIPSLTWSQINAKLDKDNKPGNRSSHSQVLMADGYSILVYGGYDGYNVYNDVAVLDTRTWTWTVKNTNAAVQGRADHTATLVNTNMIVAFGFTGVSTALTVMSDIEVLDVVTWSWTSVYTPTSSHLGGYGSGGNGNNVGEGQSGNNIPSSPSIAIVAGAVTGGLVVFVLIIVAFYMLNSYQQKRNERRNKSGSSSSANSSTSNLSSLSSVPPRLSQSAQQRNNNQRNNSTSSHAQLQHAIYHPKYRNEMMEIAFKDPPSSTEPFEYYYNPSRRPSSNTPHPLQINTSGLPTSTSDTIHTATTLVTSSPIVLVPSPWSRMRAQSISEENKMVPHSSSSSSSDWMIRRAASTPTHHPMQSIASVSKPDDRFYPPTPETNLKRAATVSDSMISLSTNNSSTATITVHNAYTTFNNSNNNSINHSNDSSEESTTHSDEDDNKFDRQEFILQSDEVAKVEEEEEPPPRTSFPSSRRHSMEEEEKHKL